MPLRFASVLCCLLAVGAGSASATTRSVSSITPSLVHRGQTTTILVAIGRAQVSCVARLRFADGKVTTTPRRKPNLLSVSFTIRIPKTAAVGAGRWSVNCGTVVAGGTFIVAGVKSTTGVEQPKVVADKQGYSQRPDKSDPGSQLSYGIILRDTSAAEDAANVYVIVNMVDAAGELLGSKSQVVKLVPAGGTYALGNSLNLRTQVGVARLELTIRVGAHAPKQEHTMPDYANVRILQSAFDPGWVSEVDGEVVNVNTPQTLDSANLSLVVLDASGNPLGGAAAVSSASLPSGSRFVFLAQNGFKAIPIDKAASVVISTEPRYSTP